MSDFDDCFELKMKLIKAKTSKIRKIIFPENLEEKNYYDFVENH